MGGEGDGEAVLLDPTPPRAVREDRVPLRVRVHLGTYKGKVRGGPWAGGGVLTRKRESRRALAA